MAPPPTKKRRTEPATVEEINFDLAARQEYLTGFHKRKVQRTKQAQEIAVKRAKAERIEARKRIRDERKADLERHVAEVNALLRPVEPDPGSEVENGNSHGSDDEWGGIETEPPAPVDHEAEYIDEDKYTTVTVEELDVSREGLAKKNEEDEKVQGLEGEEQVKLKDDKKDETDAKDKQKWAWQKPRDKGSLAKKKRKKFRYESKSERKMTRQKEHSKNKRQARERKSA